jgi:hypothetical protein
MEIKDRPRNREKPLLLNRNSSAISALRSAAPLHRSRFFVCAMVGLRADQSTLNDFSGVVLRLFHL